MSETPASPAPYSPDKNLPPVQAPTLGFLVQLFVIPGLIVAVIVMVWMLFNWLAHMGSDPSKELDVLASGSKGRWQAAYNLAKQLAEDKQGKLTGNPEMAAKMAAVLTTALDTPLNKGTKPTDINEKQEALQLRYYLVRSLGLFTVDSGAKVLLRAAAPSDDADELPVQIAALDSLGQLAAAKLTPDKASPDSKPKPWEHEADVRKTMLAASHSSQAEVKERAAFHLGQFQDEAVTERLQDLTQDAQLFTRFHAATSLAIQGDAKGLPVLREMLEITPEELLPKDFVKPDEQLQKLDDNQKKAYENRLQEENSIARDKRLLAIGNTLNALGKLHEKNPTVDLSTILPAVERLIADPNKQLSEKAKEILETLKK
jgi:hypothetical protein